MKSLNYLVKPLLNFKPSFVVNPKATDSYAFPQIKTIKLGFLTFKSIST